ncbi:uncharacterized protein Ecym_8363 [Eremothecium cymbalariae DBVPG|uniref:Uncharacterized protein n=1 Tax=Eremothecium cymbalariae (strain CBS 270.75 / DBVPG 7215 / KCTC 17166 / NRRL Y-17582) TaxID=931890 RepID=G8JXR2_ERECY|nr:Hypothetical protein Ecym_8363 [Eremothecium cymbalariae DBVPG\
MSNNTTPKKTTKIPDSILSLKNENCHLQLMLSEKGSEVVFLKNKVNQLKARLDEILVPQNVSKAPQNIPISDMLDKMGDGDDDIATHFSGSPFRGSRPLSHSTKLSSSASVSSSTKQLSYLFFTRQIVPFAQESINIFERSDLFSGQALRIKHAFTRVVEGRGTTSQNFDDMIDILDELLILQRNAIVCLNRELEYKKLTQQLEYLATIFLDPEEYGLKSKDYLEHLKKQLLDVIANVYSQVPIMDQIPQPCTGNFSGGDVEGDRTGNGNPPGLINGTSGAATTASTTNALPMSVAIAPSSNPHDKNQFKKPASSKKSGPSGRLPNLDTYVQHLESCTDSFSNFKLTTTAASPQKEQLEFIPIGFEDRFSHNTTPVRKPQRSNGLKKITLTPLNCWDKYEDDDGEENKDPLQQFYEERITGTDLEDTRTTATGFNSI